MCVQLFQVQMLLKTFWNILKPSEPECSVSYTPPELDWKWLDVPRVGNGRGTLGGACFHGNGQLIIGFISDDCPGELSNIEDVNVAKCLESIDTYKEDIVGIKIRLSAMLANDGGNEEEACR